MLTDVNLRFAGQMKDTSLRSLTNNQIKVKHLCLDASNLVTDACWLDLFHKAGAGLESVKLSNLDSALDDQTVAAMCESCPGLVRLKLKQCWKTGNASIEAISRLPALEHLSLNFIQEIDHDVLVEAVRVLAPKLKTLSLEGFHDADDELLEILRDRCRSLQKLRLTDNDMFTDAGFTHLFRGWANTSLRFVDVSSTRDVDFSNPDGPEDPTGLASEGLVALMEHSGSTIEHLNIASCRHVTHGAFQRVFAEGKRYPQLRELDVSFHTVLDDYVVQSIIRSCPALRKLTAFSCFNVRDVRVPMGLALIGGLRAQDPIVLEGGQQ